MNKVIYIESDEEIINIIDRLRTQEGERIALVVPAGALLFSSAVNLKLLKEESKKMGKDISIVADDVAGRNVASQIGFTVYETLGDAREMKEKEDEEKKELVIEKRIKYLDDDGETINEEVGYTDMNRIEEEEVIKGDAKGERIVGGGLLENEEMSTKTEKSVLPKFLSNPKTWIFGIIGVIVVLFLLVFIFPHATIYLNVYAGELDVDVSFKISESKKIAEMGDQIILPASWESSEKEVSITMQASGEKNVGDKASGVVTLYNRSGKVKLIPAGSDFISKDNKVFINPEDTSIPGAVVSDFGELIPGKSSPKLEAKEGGKAFNIEPSRFSIPSVGEMNSLIYGISEEPFSGGTDKQAKVVTKEDIELGKEKAKEEAEEILEEEFGIKGDKIFVKGLAVSSILDEETSKKEDEEADDFEVKIKANFSFLVFSKSDFDKLFDKNMGLQISDKKVLVGEGYRNVQWEVISFNESKKEAEIIGKATVLTATEINEDFFKSKITSLNIAEIRAVLSEYPEVELANVNFFPPLLLSSVPSNENNISIKVKYIDQSLSLKEWNFNAG